MNLATFFDAVRDRPFGGRLKQSQVDGCSTLIAAFQKARWPLAYAAYGLATAFHETATTMRPIAEYGRGKGRKYGVKGKHGQVAYGRGYVQLTWDFNYEKADKELALKGALLANYDLAMQPDIAADIMVRGMQEGWFTGKANRHYLDKEPPNYFDARRIINGTDAAALIAAYAKSFEAALRAAGYGAPVKTTIASPGIEVEKLPKEPYPTPLDEPARHDGKHEPPPAKSFLDRLSSLWKGRSNA